ncbi:mechanosensitive ion channel [Candidatus Bathyarchaeota archaeon]|nr:mechanosensitive ion channel [Candidatus Bathyarchaeota archaeon]
MVNEEVTPEEISRRRRRSLGRVVMLIVACGLTLVAVDLVFKDVVQVYLPSLVEYEVYINAIVVLGLGYMVVNSTANLLYWVSRSRIDHPTAALLRTITRIMGMAILLAILTSVFNVNPSAALTVGSFVGMVIGFATQTVLRQAVAGIFLVLMRPFKPGDRITVAGQTGIVKDIGIMHTVLMTEDGTTEIMIPSANIVTAVIKKTISSSDEE